MTGALVDLAVGDDRVATLTLRDGARRNALTLPMVEQIVAAVDEVERDDGVGALVVTGEPPAFCAGADLGHLGGTGTGTGTGGGDGHGDVDGESGDASESAETGLRRIYDGFLRIGRCTLPTLAAVNGAAVGAGVNLALCCDVRLAAMSARFDTRFVQLGLHPGGGHTWMLHRAVGPQAAAAAVLFGEVLNGRAAERCGLVWRCVDDDELLTTAHAMAARAAGAPRDLVQRVKASLRRAADIDTHDAAVDAELVPQVWSLQQPAFAERLKVLQAKISSASSR